MCIRDRSIADRKISNFVFVPSTDPKITSLKIDNQYTGDCLYDVVTVSYTHLTKLIEALKNAFEGVQSVIKPSYEAFREIFPPTTAQQLYDITENLRKFTANLKVSRFLFCIPLFSLFKLGK